MAIQVGGGDNDHFSTTAVIPASASIWTLMAWVRFADDTYSAPLGFGPGTTGTFYEVGRLTGGALDLWNGLTNVSGGTIALDTWTHLAIVADGTDIRVYQDGTLIITGALNGAIGSNNIEIGGVGFAGEGHRGAVAQARLFDDALTSGEITAELGSSHALAANCIGDWPLHMPGFGLYNISATDVGFSSQFPANTYNLVANGAAGTLTPGPSQSVFDFLQGGPTGRVINGTNDPAFSQLTDVLSGSLLAAGGATYQAGGTATLGASAVTDDIPNTWARADEIAVGGDQICTALYYALAAAAGDPNVQIVPTSGRWSAMAAAEFKRPADVVVETAVTASGTTSPLDISGGTPSGANSISFLSATWYDDGRPAVTGWTPLAAHPNFNNSGGSQTIGFWFRIQKTATAPSASIRFHTPGTSSTNTSATVLLTISEDAAVDTTLGASGSGTLNASADLATSGPGLAAAGTASLSGTASLAGATELAAAGVGALTAAAVLEDAVYPNAFLRIDDDNSVFIDLPTMPEVGWTIFVMMDAWKWTTPPAGEGVDPEASWFTDNNGASAGDYQREAIVLATDGRAEASINTPGVAIFRRVVTSVASSPYRITAAGTFDWGGIAVLAVPDVIDAPPQAWAKDWRPTAASPGTIPTDITFGTIANTTDYAIQIGAAHNSGHGNGIDGDGEGTVHPPRQTGTSGYVVIGIEGHNSLHLAFSAWYRVVRAIETLTPLMELEDHPPSPPFTFTACRGVQAVYGISGGVGDPIELSAEGIAAMLATAAITASITFGAAGQASGQGAASLTSATELAAAGSASGQAAAALQSTIVMGAAGTGDGTASANVTTAIPLAASGVGTGQATGSMGAGGEIAASGVATASGVAALTTAIVMQADGTLEGIGAAAITIGITLQAAAAGALTAAASLAGEGGDTELATSGQASGAGAAALTTAITLSAAGSGTANGAASIVLASIQLSAAAAGALTGAADLSAGAINAIYASGSAELTGAAAVAAQIRLAATGSATLQAESPDLETGIRLAAEGLLELLASTNLLTVVPRVYATISMQLENGELTAVVQVQRISGTLERLT